MITGGCLCGAVKYQIDAEPISCRACWCRFCQYVGAGSATINAVFPSAVVNSTGDLRDYRSMADSGNVMHRHFCPQCGTHVFSAAEARPHLTIVRVGTLDNPELAPPIASIWTAAAPSWACVDPRLPQIEGQPPPVA